jgi:hypothetical protein
VRPLRRDLDGAGVPALHRGALSGPGPRAHASRLRGARRRSG